jgi:Helix-turn-helix domain
MSFLGIRSMARAVAIPVRLVLFRRWQRGQSVSQIAAALALRPRTVRHLIQRWRAEEVEALQPAYERCGGQHPWPDSEIFDLALNLRRQHPSWGAGYIRVQLQETLPRRRLPSTRTLQRWFARAGLGPAPAGVKPASHQPRARAAHEVWEVDAVERLRLGDGSSASWLRITDEFTGAVLHTKVFPIGRFSQVGAAAVQTELKKAFTRWGRPQSLRVDNGPPWGSKGDLPTPLALWLVGLQVRVIWNPPRQPKKNAVVERTQGVSRRWVEPQTCASAHELQQRLAHADYIQREKYPSIGGRSRLESYPQLAHAKRRYRAGWERSHWSLRAVFECLSEYAVPRRVDQNGEVWMYDRAHWVGKGWIGQTVYVTVDPQTQEWIYQDERGGVIRRQAAKDLTRERVSNIQLGRGHK